MSNFEKKARWKKNQTQKTEHLAKCRIAKAPFPQQKNTHYYFQLQHTLSCSYLARARGLTCSHVHPETNTTADGNSKKKKSQSKEHQTKKNVTNIENCVLVVFGRIKSSFPEWKHENTNLHIISTTNEQLWARKGQLKLSKISKKRIKGGKQKGERGVEFTVT